jgi:tetratricopeptide (TPR) repeat protein
MRLLSVLLTISVFSFGQSSYNYYKRADRVGSKNEKAFTYFKKAYYDHIWNWTDTGSDSAVYYLQMAIKEDSSYGAAYAFLGHVYKFKTYDAADKDEFKNQKWYAERALALAPQLGDAYTLMATVKWSEGDKAAALTYLRKAAQIEPDHVGNFIWLGMRLGTFPEKKDSAIYYFHRIMRMDPEYGQAYMKLAGLYFDYKAYDSALYYYNKAIRHYETVKPRDLRMINGYLYSAVILKDEFKNYVQAESNLRKYMDELAQSDFMVKDQAQMDAHAMLADCYRRMGEDEIQKLIRHNENFLTRHPGDFIRTVQVIDGYLALSNDTITVKHALPLAKQLKTLAKTDEERMLSLSIHIDALERTKRLSEAITLVGEYTKRYPDNFKVLMEAGRVHAKNGDNKKALSFLKEARENLKTEADRAFFAGSLNNKDFDALRQNKDFKNLM